MRATRAALLALLFGVPLASFAAAQSEPERPSDGPQAPEDDYYLVDYLTPPDGAVLEVGGLGFLPDGRLAVSTRRGQVWLVEDPLADDPADTRFELFAEGLQEGLGLAVEGGDVVVVQRGELSRLRDTDSDGRADRIETISDAWGVSGNYHEFAFGLPVDDAGNFYVSLNVAFFEPKWWHGKSPALWRGWALRVAPDGTTTPVAAGFRSPCGIARNSAGDLFVTDNQGDWVPSSPIYHLVEGRFYGHPASLDWTDDYRASATLASDTVPPDRERARAAVWIPYDWSRSTGNLVEDATGGRFGPFEGQLFVAELTNGLVLRVALEKVRGEYQGACFLHREGIGSVARVAFAPDGTLFCGMTNRGWGGLPPADGIARVRWTGRTPMEMRSAHLLQDGFEVGFTLPVASDVELVPENLRVWQYDYDYWWEYGSPQRHVTDVEVTGVALSPDRRTLTLHTAGLTPGMVCGVGVGGVRSADGQPLQHEIFHYTINQLPEGPPTSAHVAKLVPPPPARESGWEGWLRLTWGDATDLWTNEGWRVADVELDRDDATRLVTSEGDGALVAEASNGPASFTSEPVFQDGKFHTDVLLAEGARASFDLMGRYRIELADTPRGTPATPATWGGLAPGAGFPGRAADLESYGGPGTWHSVDVFFEAPRFDASGAKVRNARVQRVLVDDVLLHENVELPGPTVEGATDEIAEGPLVLRATRGAVAIRDVRAFPFRRLDEAAAEPVDADAGWTPLFEDDDELSGWTTTGDAQWRVEDDVLTAEGGVGHLFSPRGDYGDVEVRAKVKISEGGNSGLYVRAQPTDTWPDGYEAQINASHPDPQKTGSVYGLAPVKTHLVGPDTWFDYRVLCRDEPGGTRIQVRVNGILVSDVLDPERRHTSGHVALQQHHEGSVLEVRDLAVRDLH